MSLGGFKRSLLPSLASQYVHDKVVVAQSSSYFLQRQYWKTNVMKRKMPEARVAPPIPNSDVFNSSEMPIRQDFEGTPFSTETLK